MTYISGDRVYMEWKLPKMIRQSKDHHKVDACMKFCDKTRPLHLEVNASEVGLGARLLQIRDGMSYAQDKAPHNRE